MRLTEITFKPTAQVLAMTDKERHDLLEFIYDWLSGKHMSGPGESSNLTDDELLTKWRQIAQLFPPKVPKSLNLFRLVTVPIAYAEQQHFVFNPAPRRVSSWTRTLTGLDAVAGIATDKTHNYGSYKDKTETARIGIEATIPGELVLATPTSMRNAFMTLSHDYEEKYGSEWDTGEPHPDYPGGSDPDRFSMDDIGFLHDVMNRPGGNYHQYEYVVQTPSKVEATLVQIYRVGDKNVRRGNDDPHQFYGRWPAIRRKKFKTPRS